MITVNEVQLRFAEKILFDNVNLKFTPGNCYGVIGANGSGKSTFLKLLSSDIDTTKGTISITPGERLAVLKQNHFEFDEYTALETVMKGHDKLYSIMQEKDAIYLKEDFTEEDGNKAADLEAEFAELDGWNAETNAEKLLMDLGVNKEYVHMQMVDIPADNKVKILLAQALYYSPDILLLDEPTNHLDFHAINWLENFLLDYENTVIVVSHDRHFLNKVCTHMVDIDFGKIKMFVGNYDFWAQSSELALKLMKDQNKKKEEKIKELQGFIARFSSNASKAKQATSRKKLLEKIQLDDIKPSSRKYPFVGFTLNRELGKDILSVDSISKTINGEKVLNNVSFTMARGDKIAFMAKDPLAVETLFKILNGDIEPDEGSYKWGLSIEKAMLPKDNSEFFDDKEDSLLDWLRLYSPEEQSEIFIRGFLGKMLFSNDEVFKKVNVLSGGEKMRCMFARLMLTGANFLIVNEPTNHLDLESIQAVNNGFVAFKGSMIFNSHDHKFIQTISNKVAEITDDGVIMREMSFDDYLEMKELQDYGNKE